MNGLLGMCLNSTETNPGDNHDEQEYKEEYVNQDDNRATSKAQRRQKAERKKMNKHNSALLFSSKLSSISIPRALC